MAYFGQNISISQENCNKIQCTHVLTYEREKLVEQILPKLSATVKNNLEK